MARSYFQGRNNSMSHAYSISVETLWGSLKTFPVVICTNNIVPSCSQGTSVSFHSIPHLTLEDTCMCFILAYYFNKSSCYCCCSKDYLYNMTHSKETVQNWQKRKKERNLVLFKRNGEKSFTWLHSSRKKNLWE